MASEQSSFQSATPLHPLLGDKQQNELAAEKLRREKQAKNRAAHRAWTGLYQYEQRKAEAAEIPTEEREHDVEAQKLLETAIQSLADNLNENVLSSNQQRLDEGGWTAALEPLISKITGQPITLFPTTLPELYEVDETELNRMLWHLGINQHVPPPPPPLEEVLGIWRISNTPISNIHPENTPQDKQHWIRTRWVGDVKYGRCTLLDCFMVVGPPLVSRGREVRLGRRLKDDTIDDY